MESIAGVRLRRRYNLDAPMGVRGRNSDNTCLHFMLRDGDLLLEWAPNLMVLGVSIRRYRRAVWLPEGDLPGVCGDGTSKSAVSRRFVALSRKKMRAWLSSDLSSLDLLVLQIDGLHVGDYVLVAAIGVDGNGEKYVLAVVEGATENTVTVQALLDNLTSRGLDQTVPRLFIVDGAEQQIRIVLGKLEDGHPTYRLLWLMPRRPKAMESGEIALRVGFGVFAGFFPSCSEHED